MKVLVLGGSGFTGKKVLKELLRKEFYVTTTTRSLDRIQIKNENLVIKVGDVSNEKFLTAVISGQDAVINCLGINGKGTGKPTILFSEITREAISVMENLKVKRYVAMSNVGAGDSWVFLPLIFRKLILPYFMRWLKVIIDDKNRMEAIIRRSALDWTILRFPNIIDNRSKSKIHSTLTGKGLKLSITNADAARIIVEQLEDNQFIKKAPSVSN